MSDSVPPTPAPPPVQTADAFLRLVRLSGLVEPARMGDVEAALAAWRGADGPMPEACSKPLIDGRLLSEWQIGKLCLGRSRGFFLGKCKLLQPLGKGGMGNVYLAEHTTLKARVAVKVLPQKQDDTKSPEQQERFEANLRRFEREAQAAAALSHPNIARAFDLDTSELANHFIVMEYIDGTDLEKRVKADGPLGVRDAADLVRQAALGLERAHEEGLVHRDIKPANLMVDSRGQLKILDLGLVQVDAPEGSSDPELAQDDRDKIMGTPDYMSPEQVLAQKVDRRSDIYSLGCTFYYLLTGHAPFEKTATVKPGSNKRAARMRAHCKQPAPNVLDARPDTPVEIVELILRMMEKAPEARPQWAREVADSLTTWLSTNAATPPRAQPGLRRRAALRQAAGDDGARAAPSDAGSDGSHSGEAAPSSGTWAEFDVHAPSQSDIRRASGGGRLSGSTSQETVRGSVGPTVGGDDISFDADGDSGLLAAAPRREPRAAQVASGGPVATGGPAPSTAHGQPAAAPWLFRRVVGLPVVVWACILAAMLSAAVCAGVWWLMSGPAGEEAEDDTTMPTVEEEAVTPPPRKQKPAPQKPATKSREKKSTVSGDGAEPSPLDRMLQPAKPTATPAEPAAASEKPQSEKAQSEKSR
jgi:serine/threonine protein kinase